LFARRLAVPVFDMTDDTEQEYVYAVAHPHNYVKVGRSKNPQQRLQDFQIGTPYQLWLLAALPVEDSRRVERELHEHLSDKQERGEWFAFDFDDYDMIVDMMKMAGSRRDFASLADFYQWQERKEVALR
jgi:hypothetical protein